MNQTEDVSRLAQILHQIKNEMQVVLARVSKLSDLVQQLSDVTAEDATARRYAEQMTQALDQVDQRLADLVFHLRERQTQLTSGAEPGVTESSPPRRKRILVIDDERSVVELVDRVLKSRGYQVDTVCDGYTAIQMVEAHSYDLIMVDLKMPDIGGMDIYHQIESQNPVQAHRFVFFSGDVVSPHTTAWLNRIGLPFLVKPFTIQELVSFVEQALV
jgi:CheY-like chemotaxis protein